MSFTTDGKLCSDSGKIKYVFKKGEQIISSISIPDQDSLNFESNINSMIKQLSLDHSCSESDIQWSKKELI